MSAASPTSKKRKRDQQERAVRDSRLIEAYRGGRSEAFDELVLAYDQHVRRIPAQFRVPASDAEDLLQEVFVRIFRNLPRFSGESSFYTWLYRITVHVFFDHNKKRKRADVRLARLQNTLVDVTNVRDGRGDPFDACYDALTHEAFSKAIDALPESFRTVVAMREVHDLSYEDIAFQTGISIGTVRSRLSRARVRLRLLLRPMTVPTAA